MDIRRIFLVPLLAAALVVFFATVDSVGAQQESALDLTVKISRIESLLDRIDAMAAETQPEGGQSPSMMLRGMIQGTDWIDPQRPVVIGIEMVNGKFAAAALVPFSRPNENFARSFNAMSAPDHYIVPLPPGKPLSLSDAALASLVSTSGVRPESSVSVEIAAKRLLQKAEPTLRKRIAEIEIPPQTTSAAPKIAAEDVRTLLEGMIDLGRQVQSFSFGGDIFAEQFRFISETRAVAGSQMARLFSSGASVARVGELASDHQVRFKTRAYDIAGAVEMFADIIGPVYRKIGIDFAGLTEIASHFTGESAGGASYGADGVQFEMITVLTEQAAETDFLGKVYLPWVESYSRQMAATLSSLLGSEVPEIYRRTPDSTVAGVRVVGGRHTQPLFAADPAAGIPETTMTTEVRIAQIGELLLFAPDDRRMASLIQEARAMAPAPEQGPHMRVQIDMAAYFNGLMAMLPPSERPQIELPDTSSMESTLTFSGTRAIARATMKGAGIADMAAAAQAAKAAGPVMAAQAGRKSHQTGARGCCLGTFAPGERSGSLV